MTTDILFRTIEEFHGSDFYGDLLDAGTGVNSLLWIKKLATTSWTAITAV
jgi:hypothetical protein